MVSKRSRFGIPLIASAMLAAAILLGSAIHAQDMSKSRQIEGPLVKLLKGNTDAAAEIDAATRNSDNDASIQPKLMPNQPSLGKLDIESPVESLLVGQDNLNQLISDVGKLSKDNRAISKGFIEMPIEQLVDLGREDEEAAIENADTVLTGLENKSENPAVDPGLVNWHSGLKSAALQSKVSGKPVFHFQLLGQLDQRFT
ncbi:hypothetical protein N9Y42_10835 [Mariniblastus sp.]|nr:hypothetical protein [Mariniblastus sp.]